MKKQDFAPFFFLKIFQNQSHIFVLFEALLLVGLIGWMDYANGLEYSLFVFYALPIVLIAWKTDRQLGLAFAILCTITWWGVHIDSNPFQSRLGFALAVLNRLFYFVVLVVAVSAVKRKQELDRALIERLIRAQKLERNILEASEREQQRIGRDLHDSLGPHLAAIRYAAAFLANDLHQQDQPEAAKAKHIHELVNDATLLLRDLVQGIFPEQLEDFCLSMAIEDLASSTSRLSNKSVYFRETGDALINCPQVGLQLYRIVQEAVNNAIKHGDAQKITIILSKIESSLQLVIDDDGKGILLPPNGTRGMGLSSMRYRARALGGDLKIDAKPNGGTIVFCEIPYPTSLFET